MSSSSSASGPTGSATGSMLRRSPRDFLQYFFERWWIGLIFGLIAGAAFVFLQPEKEVVYRTEVSLVFEQRKQRPLNVPDFAESAIRPGELNNHMEQIRSQTFFEYVLASLSRDEIKRIQEAYRDAERPDSPLPSLGAIIRPNLNVFARRGTTIIGISVINRDPEMAALIANRYARKYIDYNLDRANTGTNSAIVFLRSQAEDMKAQVEAAEAALQDYRSKYNMAALGENQNVIVQKLGSLHNVLVTTQMEQQQLASLLSTIKAHQASGRSLLEISAIASYGQVSALHGRLTELQSQRTMMGERYLSEHPRMKSNELEIQEVSRRLQENIDQAIAGIETRHRTAVEYEKGARAELEKAEEQARELDKISVDYRFLEGETANKRATYSRIINSLSDANISSQMDNLNIKIFDPAWVPSTPAGGGKTQLAMKAGALGFGFLIGIPILLGLLDTRIKTASQIEDGLNEALLGIVKRIKGMGERERAHAFQAGNDDGLSESYRGIYSEIEVRSLAPFPKAMLVTSSLPSEGKSLTACNLASVFAAHGRRTLLIDCDLRRPSIHRYFGVSNRESWTEWLIQREKQAEVPLLPPATAVSENLYLLPATASGKNPTEILGKFCSSGTLEQLLQEYSLIIFDTPPSAVFPDGLLLARYCQELVYICKFNTIRLGIVKRTLERLRESGVSVMGVVLNQMPERKMQSYGYHGYGAYGSDYYKSYADSKSDGS